MSAVAAKPAAGAAMNPTAMGVGVVLLIILLAICWSFRRHPRASWPSSASSSVAS